MPISPNCTTAQLNMLSFIPRRSKMTPIKFCFVICFSVTFSIFAIFTTTQKLALSPSETSIVASFGKGRIGNQMSSYASLYAFERQYGVRSFMTRAQMNAIKDFFSTNLLLHNMKVLEDNLPYWFLYNWQNVFENDDLSDTAAWTMHLTGTLMDVGEYPNEIFQYKEYLPQLRNIFKPKQNFRDIAQAKLKQISAKHFGKIPEPKVTFVSVHVRRSDYANHLSVLYNLSYVQEDYFNQAFHHFRSYHQNVLFYLVTDDPEWCQKSLQNSHKDVYLVGSRKSAESTTSFEIGVDLALLSLANHSILTYGTFGMWGALLSGGQVLSPSSHNITKEQKEIAKAKLAGWITI